MAKEFIRPKQNVVIPSQTSAINTTQEWTLSHDYSTITDADGWLWKFERQVTEKVDQSNKPYLNVNFTLTTNANSTLCAKTDILDPELDQRLIQLLSKDRLSFQIPIKSFIIESIRELDSLTFRVFKLSSQRLNTTSLYVFKRQVIGDHIDAKMAFGPARYK